MISQYNFTLESRTFRVINQYNFLTMKRRKKNICFTLPGVGDPLLWLGGIYHHDSDSHHPSGISIKCSKSVVEVRVNVNYFLLIHVWSLRLWSFHLCFMLTFQQVTYSTWIWVPDKDMISFTTQPALPRIAPTLKIKWNRN